MGIFRSLIVLLVGAALATFLWSNYDQGVVISFTARFRTVEIPLSAALIGAMVAGFFLAVALSLPHQFRLRGRVRELRKQLERVESEIAELRKLPLSDMPDVSESSVEGRSGSSPEIGSKAPGS